jgi:hypothetical protein
VLMYRAMIGLEKYSTVKAEISDDASSDLQAVKRLARYIHRKADRADCVSVRCSHPLTHPHDHSRIPPLIPQACTPAFVHTSAHLPSPTSHTHTNTRGVVVSLLLVLTALPTPLLFLCSCCSPNSPCCAVPRLLAHPQETRTLQDDGISMGNPVVALCSGVFCVQRQQSLFLPRTHAHIAHFVMLCLQWRTHVQKRARRALTPSICCDADMLQSSHLTHRSSHPRSPPPRTHAPHARTHAQA